MRFSFTLRGVLILVATALGIIALIAGGSSLVMGLGAILLWALILMLTGLRQADLNSRVRTLNQDLQRTKRSREDRGTGYRKMAPYGPRGIGEVEIEHARRKLNRVRQALALSAMRPPMPRSEQVQARNRSNDSNAPLVSVVVPCFNDGSVVDDCLKSLRAQTFEDWECVVVDDGSVDDSPTTIATAAMADERIRYVRHGVNSGLSAARNTGLRLSRGELVAFVDADDMLAPDSLLDRVEALAQHLGNEHVAGAYCGVQIGSEITTADQLESEEWTAPLGVIDFINGSEDCPFPVLSPLVRRDVLVGIGGFDESMRHGAEDWDLWQRVLRAGYTFVPSRLRSAVYRQRPQTMAKRDAAKHVEEGVRLVSRAYSSVIDRSPNALPGAFDEGLAHYLKHLSVGRRAIRSAAMALVNGDRTEASGCLSVLESGSWAWLDRHVDVRGTAGDGVRRALGLKRESLVSLSRDAEPFVSEIVSAVAKKTDGELPTDFAITPVPEVDLLVAPGSRAQLEAMLAECAAEKSDLRLGILLLDRVAGDQGVNTIVEEIGFPSWSLNEWWLQAGHCRVLLVPSVREATLEALVEVAEESGVGIREVREPGAETMKVLDRGSIRVFDVDENPESHDAVALQFGWLSPFSGGSLDDPIAPDSLWRLEESPELRVDSEEIEKFRDFHSGETVVIIGNGPSLNQTDLRLLGETPSIGVNAIFLATDDLGFRPTYYVVEDTAVVRDNLDRIHDYRTTHRFFPSIYRDAIGKSEGTSYFNMNQGFYDGKSPSYCIPRFSTDAALRLFSGQSVTIINLQLAYYMGFAEVVLIGMDFSYTVPEDSIVEGNRILSQGDDPNHFHPDYFGKGKVWKDPKLDRVLANYQLAKLMFEADGRRIVNATPGGKLELFDRVLFNEFFPTR